MISRRRLTRRLRRHRTALLRGVLVASAVIIGLALWLGVDLLRARGAMNDARAGLVSATDRVHAGDVEAAKGQLHAAAQASTTGAHLADSPPFVVFSHVPLLRGPVVEVRALAHALDDVAGKALPALVDSDVRVPTWTGRIDPAPFVSAQQPLARAEAVLDGVSARLRGTRSSGIAQITRARHEFEDSLFRLRGTVHEVRVAADVIPSMAGAQGPRRYFIALQNNAEARGTGGLIGAFGLLRVDDGRMSLERVAENDQLVDPDGPALRMADDYEDRYGRFETTRTWRSANLSPDTPTAAQIVRALWAKQSGERVDGVVFMDPVALGQLLGAVGGVRLTDGTTIDESNAVRVLESDVYRRYQGDQAPRFAYLSETARTVFDALRTRTLDGRSLARHFADAVGTGHLQVWSADPQEEAVLRRSRVAGELRSTGPFLSVVTNDAGGSKLDYYLHRSVTYEGASTGVAVDLGDGPQLEEQATVTVRLDNQAPAGLPSYVTARPDDPKSPPGQAKTWVSVYLGERASLLGATLDGQPVTVESATEHGLTVLSAFVTTNRGSSTTLALSIKQPADPAQTLVYRQQPLIRDDDIVVRRTGSPVPVSYIYALSPATAQ